MAHPRACPQDQQIMLKQKGQCARRAAMSQKRRDRNTFLQYLRNHKPPLTHIRCSGVQAIEFMRYLDQSGKTKVYTRSSLLRASSSTWPLLLSSEEAWVSLDALVGRLRATYEENGASKIQTRLRREQLGQAKAQGIPYEKKHQRRKDTLASWSDVTVGGIVIFNMHEKVGGG